MTKANWFRVLPKFELQNIRGSKSCTEMLQFEEMQFIIFPKGLKTGRTRRPNSWSTKRPNSTRTKTPINYFYNKPPIKALDWRMSKIKPSVKRGPNRSRRGKEHGETEQEPPLCRWHKCRLFLLREQFFPRRYVFLEPGDSSLRRERKKRGCLSKRRRSHVVLVRSP